MLHILFILSLGAHFILFITGLHILFCLYHGCRILFCFVTGLHILFCFITGLHVLFCFYCLVAHYMFCTIMLFYVIISASYYDVTIIFNLRIMGLFHSCLAKNNKVGVMREEKEVYDKVCRTLVTEGVTERRGGLAFGLTFVSEEIPKMPPSRIRESKKGDFDKWRGM